MKTTIIIVFSIFLVLIISCRRDNTKLPVVITTPVTELTWDSVKAGGEVISDGGSPVTARGICVTISKIDPPTIIDSWETWHTNDNAGLGSFMSASKLVWAGASHTIRQNHYISAYATNIAGTAYGEVIEVYPNSKPPKFASVNLVGANTSSVIINFTIGLPGVDVFEIDEIDICISNSTNPTIDGTHFLIPKDQLSKNDTIKGLTPNTTYYLRGYVKNESGIAYSPEISFTTWEGAVTDISGNIYQYKTIGSQQWMLKNLTTSKFNDGTLIPYIQDNLEWGSTSSSASCTYTSFGKLYNFYAVSDSRKLCPAGWHIPSDTEWKTLEMYLGMTHNQADATGFRGTDEGGKLKHSILDINIWKVPNTGATNSSGFSAFGGGYRYDNGLMTNSVESANFWTSSEADATSAWSRSLSYNSAQISRFNINKKYGFSIRCLKD